MDPQSVTREGPSPDPPEYSPYTWLLEEYRLLSQHYFHEDGQLLRAVGLYATFNGALLAFLGSRFVELRRTATLFIPVIGIVLCLSWVATMVRLRELRTYIETRIAEIEETLHEMWGMEEPLPLDIRTFRKWDKWAPPRRWYAWPYRVLRNWPASLTILTLPIAFALVWVVLLTVAVWQWGGAA